MRSGLGLRRNNPAFGSPATRRPSKAQAVEISGGVRKVTHSIPALPGVQESIGSRLGTEFRPEACRECDAETGADVGSEDRVIVVGLIDLLDAPQRLTHPGLLWSLNL